MAELVVNSRIKYYREYIQHKTLTSHQRLVMKRDGNVLDISTAKITSSVTPIEGSIASILTPTNPYASRARYSEGQVVKIDVELPSLLEVGSIVVTHNSNESLEFSTVVIQVSDDGARWYTLYDSAWEGTYVESSAGKEIKTSYTAQSHDGSGAIKDTPSSAFFDPKIRREIVQYTKF
jgi:hypothetical protein